MLTFVAVLFQVYELTGSSLAVGLLGVAEFVPILVLALVGVRASVVAGGVACVAGTVALALALPRFWRYDSRDTAGVRA